MLSTKYTTVASILVLGVAVSGCSQDEAAGVAEETATAVHVAEVAAGTAEDMLARGEQVYLANCAACHQPGGSGLAGAFPPLAQSDYLLGDRKTVLTAALFGLSGPIVVNGENYDAVMPSMGHLPDEDLAAALS